jgi:hypothetical protein
MNILIEQGIKVISLTILLGMTLPVSAQDSAAPASGAACPAATGECACEHGAGKHGAHHGKGGPGGMGMGPGMGADMGMARFERMGDELALAETQKQELVMLIEMYRPRMLELVKRGEDSRKAIMTMPPDDPAYNTRAAELSQAAGASAAEMVTLLTELQSNAYALLNDEQQAKYMQLRSERQARIETRKAEIKEQRESGEWQPGMYRQQCKSCPHGATDTAE